MKQTFALISLCLMALLLLPACRGNNSSTQGDDSSSAKPVIYLYPEVETEVAVRLDYDGELTCTYPAYDGGWTVTAQPNGTLMDASGQTYNYLYWEGITQTEDALAQLGLTRREANEFIVYWLPRMEANPYNLISFQSAAYTDHARLTISPEPDSLLRVFMAWQPLETPADIPPQNLPIFERTGFTVVEWGGAEITSGKIS